MGELTPDGLVLLGVVVGSIGTLVLLFVACELVAAAQEWRR